MKKIRIGMACDGDLLKVREGSEIVDYEIIKISNNFNAWCRTSKGICKWINTAIEENRIIGAYTR